jgi:hypothetical protein
MFLCTCLVTATKRPALLRHVKKKPLFQDDKFEERVVKIGPQSGWNTLADEEAAKRSGAPFSRFSSVPGVYRSGETGSLGVPIQSRLQACRPRTNDQSCRKPAPSRSKDSD